jgi:hypothetical protein
MVALRTQYIVGYSAPGLPKQRISQRQPLGLFFFIINPPRLVMRRVAWWMIFDACKRGSGGSNTTGPSEATIGGSRKAIVGKLGDGRAEKKKKEKIYREAASRYCE